jgi:O-succinylbenzoic acid--CoA ligase
LRSINITGLSEDAKNQILIFCEEFENGKESFILRTSGSTGEPKEITISRDQMVHSAQMTINALGLKSGYRSLLCLNTSYIAGQMMLVRSIIGEMECIIVSPSSDPLSEITQSIDFAAFVPFQLYSMLIGSEKELRKVQLNQMKAIIIGGEDVNYTLLQWVRQLHVPVYHTYGMTETVSHIALKLLNGNITQNSFEILEGVEIKSDERACLQIKSYVTGNQWITTNDKVEIIDNKHFNWLGRIDNVIVTGGIKIQIEMVEKAIEAFFYNQKFKPRFFIFGTKDEALGQKVVLAIESSISILPEVEQFILQKLTSLLPKYYSPKQIVVLKEFEYLPTGKIDRKTIISKLK